ncbi:YggT family protein [Schleiferilactobacillus perolens]|uniref:YggT family protein n=1 Tax=Schleiferilactobacillus perolens DSM 12744 TaxID=1423792 RepID=A0A0R1N221_9LACO|nr:YggT family protein [Schleiferilactobacillus perolens]KRL14209.1 hypothetical protein FD09_GL001373 [Schleiferilactobacillus perolens DSM 12744]MCI1892478.1 YggT family protein [Schleiferilactobacillus harbinensis]MCI1913354.1 YggT family protein [Schleiferilactobacillus harbinensis]MCI2171295.1 YggT family protein [Schleiferilactobacillus perolens]
MINFIFELARLINYAINIYAGLIIVYALLTWIPSVFNTRLGNLVARVVEPYLNFFNRFVPPIFGISLAPLIAIVALELFGQGLIVIAQWVIRLIAGY